MRYFTKDWYRESQVYGFLTFHSTKEEWESDIQWYESQGQDYKQVFREELEWRRSDLMHFLPEFFHPYILDGSLNSQYPSDELRKMTEEWREQFQQKNKEIRKQYLEEFNEGKEALPKNALQFHEKSLHDATVTSFEFPTVHTFVVLLDAGGFHYSTKIKLTFVGVEELHISEEVEGANWLCNEIYPTNTGFELRVLFDGPLCEMTIKTKNVFIEELNDES